MMNAMRAFALFLAASMIAAPGPVFAMGGGSEDGSDSAASAGSSYAMGLAAVKKQDWPQAMRLMSKAIDENPKDANAYNYLGYARRQSGDFKGALKAYGVALKLNPDHKGAHEYAGQAYLGMGNIAKAQEHLRSLDSLCLFGCAEYTSLKNAIAKAKAAS